MYMAIDSHDTEPRKGSPSPRIDEAEFRRRFRSQFSDPSFEAVDDALEKVVDVRGTRTAIIERARTFEGPVGVPRS